MFSNHYIQAPGDRRLATTSVFSANLEPNFLHGFLKNGHWTRGKGLWAAFRIFSDTKKYPLNFYFELVKNNKILSAVRICFYINKEGFLTPLCMTLRFYISEVFWLLPRLGLCFCFCFFFSCTSILRQNSYCCMSAMLSTVFIWSKTNEFASCTGPERGPPGLSFVQ